MPSLPFPTFRPLFFAAMHLVASLLIAQQIPSLGAEAPAPAKTPTDTTPPAIAAAKELATMVQNLARDARSSVVVVTASGREASDTQLGTGFIISADGLVATNYHVIGEGRPLEVRTADGKQLEVIEIHATDRNADLAVLRVKAEGLPFLKLGDSAKVAEGEPIVVLGNPRGLRHSVVSGVISGMRDIDEAGLKQKMLQIAMPIEPGNSGGPVLNLAGEVLGVVTMKSLVTENLGFAIQVSDLKRILENPNSLPIARWISIGALDPKQWTTLFGARWSQRGGKLLVTGQGNGFGGRSLCLSQEKPPELPFEVSVMVKMDDEAGAAGLVFHSDGENRHYGFYPSAGNVRLSRFEGPDVFSWQVLYDKPTKAYRAKEWNTLKVRVEEGAISCFVNDELVTKVEDRVYTSGQVGLAKFRQTSAEFRRFQVGKSVPRALPSESEASSIREQVAMIPSLREIVSESLSPFTKNASASVHVLRDEAARLRARADELTRIAADVRTASVVEELRKVAGPEVAEVDLLAASLWIASLDEEDVDVTAYIKQVDRMAAEVKSSFTEKPADDEKITKLNRLLFDELGFHGSRADYYQRANSYFNRVLDDREGLPITLSVLYLSLAKRIDLPMEGVGMPGHFLVRHRPVEGEPQLLDPFDRGAKISREQAAKLMLESSGAVLEDEHLVATPHRAIVVRMLQNLLNLAQGSQDREAMIRYLDAMIAVDPALVRERGLRAIVRFETGRKQAAAIDLDWFLEKKPEGIDLEQIESMRAFFLEDSGKN
ncbi:peptidase S1 and S6 chymotrypsin/Hap [Pirellula staleyi DSM 6068]|uniref:Peptidase S1 and S6 chymotrypsin/Hap n=1 Tax=Pirellula staleyi (strain ATCC 27377 / DSM 6068 / ICPB 4128) TaxID=530564 RepID=D2R4Q5_PIRSD|nr:tetratricopeptide repeat protein [Pirellula staleyi]ADB17121.1 peptidase S1 and S6 chymotrypsin/Hap [Pirellula staleyi DSM 6068]